MKLLTLALVVLIVIQYSDQSTIRVRRKITIFNTLSEKATGAVNYVKDKGIAAVNYIKGTGRSIKQSIFYTKSEVENKLTKMENKLKNVINKADATKNFIYEVIAPSQIDNECSNDDVMNKMTTPQLIAVNGYASESHTIITEDGYILTVHRIPYSRKSDTKTSPRKTVLLQHGLLGSSADWVIPGPGRGLAYILADAGYDVWMANVRGNTYSRQHVSRPIDSYAFWNFTFHEIAQYDVPAVVNFIVNKKGRDVKINYIGFSMGTTVLFALLSTKPEYNEILRAGYVLAPVVYMRAVKSPFVLLSRKGDTIESFLKLIGAYEFLPRNAAMRYLSKHSCQITYLEEAMCELSMFTLCGHSQDFDISLKPMILGHIPAGASTKTLAHYAQEMRNGGRFQQFDYGMEGNLKQYGTVDPPEYSLQIITLPIAILSGEGDWLSGLLDAMRLFHQLQNPIEHYKVPLKEFNHLDFLFAREAKMLVYDKLLDMLERSYASDEVI